MTSFIFLSIFIPGHMYDWGIERLFVAYVILMSVCCFITNNKLRSWIKITPSNIIVICLCLTIICLFGYSRSVIVGVIDTGIRDYFEILRWLIYMIFILFVARFFTRRHVATFTKLLLISLFYSFFVFLLYKVNFPFLSDIFVNSIYLDAKTWFTSDGYGRLSVPFENPNFLAFYLNLTLVYTIFFMKSSRITKYTMLVLALALLYLTGSRSGWICCLIIIFFWVLLNLRLLFTSQRFKAMAYLLIFLVVSTFCCNLIIHNINSNYRILSLVQAMENGGIISEANLSGRIQQMKDSWEYTVESPFFGWGTAKYSVMQVIDSQYFTWLFRYGLVGSLLILLIMLYLICQLLILASSNHRYFMGLLALFSQCIVMLGTGAFLDNFRLFFITIILLQTLWIVLNNDKFISNTIEGDSEKVCYLS